MQPVSDTWMEHGPWISPAAFRRLAFTEQHSEECIADFGPGVDLPHEPIFQIGCSDTTMCPRMAGRTEVSAAGNHQTRDTTTSSKKEQARNLSFEQLRTHDLGCVRLLPSPKNTVAMSPRLWL